MCVWIHRYVFECMYTQEKRLLAWRVSVCVCLHMSIWVHTYIETKLIHVHAYTNKYTSYALRIPRHMYVHVRVCVNLCVSIACSVFK